MADGVRVTVAVGEVVVEAVPVGDAELEAVTVADIERVIVDVGVVVGSAVGDGVRLELLDIVVDAERNGMLGNDMDNDLVRLMEIKEDGCGE